MRIFDYVDLAVPMLAAMFKKRLRGYRSIGYARGEAPLGYFLDTIDQLDDGWVEVAYEDGDVRVHGFVSTQDPPARTHRRLPAEAAPPSFTPDATLADHTCLFVSGEPVGFIVGGEPADVEPSPRAGWLTLTIDTPWGPIAFEGRGATEASLATCGI